MIGSVKLKTIQSDNGVFVLVFGGSGYGKTSSIRSFPKDKTIIICSEPQGLTSLIRFGWEEARVICPTTSDAFLQAVEDAIQDESARHIVVDTLSQYYELLIKEYVECSGKSPEKIGLDMYRVSGLKFQRVCRRLLDGLAMGKDIVGLVHMNYREDVSGEDKRNIREPALPGQLPQWIARQAALVVRAEKVRQGKDIRYLLLADGTEGDYGKDLFGVMGSLKDNDLWPIMQQIREQQPVAPVTPKTLEKVTGYGALLQLAAKAKVAKPELDNMITQMRIDIKKATPEDFERIQSAFVSKYNPPF